jgi:histidinol-phosphate/aromatic aminotransferase/cobyric acid decarboxylase-like protein
LPQFLRITVGDRKTCENLLKVIEEFLVGQK